MTPFFTFGETMLRLSPPQAERLETARSLEVHVGGAESNVAVTLARLGKRSIWMSRLPDTPPGHLIENAIRGQGVETDHVVWAQNERAGTYYMERATPPRPARVWYDRAESAASRLSAADIPLEIIRADTWLHLTGITPALSPECADAVTAALAHARDNGAHTSLDVNYRSLLWSPTDAAAMLEPLCHQAEVIFIAARDAETLFKTRDIGKLQNDWGGIVIMSDSTNGALGCDSAGREVRVPAYLVQIVERLGAGDAFAAGVICRLSEDAFLEDAIRFGCAAAALKLTIPGDFALISRAEVEALITTGGSATLTR